METIRLHQHQGRTKKSGNALFYAMASILVLIYMMMQSDTFSVEQMINMGNAYDSRVAAYSFSFLAMLLGALTPFPAELIALTNAFIYSPIEAFFVTWLSAVLSAQIAYEFGRLNTLNPCQYKDSNKICYWLNNHGYKALVILRLIPFVPFFALNICCGIFRLNRSMYFMITALAMLPAVVLLTFFPQVFR